MIELDDVRFRYGEDGAEVLSGVTLTIGAGELLLVVGASGTGKSTLLRCLNGLIPHFHGGVLGGRVRVAGRDPVSLGPHAMSEVVGFVFQDPESQFVAERVDDEIVFALENRNTPPEVMDRRLGEVLGLLAIPHLRRRRLATLSGGERQRVAVASVLVLRPAVLVLDEPTSQLDPRAADELFIHLGRLHRERGLTVVVSEHRLERVAGWADRVCWLPCTGVPPKVGPPREVLGGADLAPPVARLGRRLGWTPPPLTVEQAREFVAPSPSPRENPPPTPPLPKGEGLLPNQQQERWPSPNPDAPPLEKEGSRGDFPLAAARGVVFRYPGGETEALRGASLALAAGERVALMGPNGGGKSTLLKCLVGLLTPQEGTVEVLGRTVSGRPLTEVTAAVGFVPQNPARLLFNDTVADEVRFTRRSHSLPREGDAAATAELLGRLDLAHRADAWPADLSTGERQRAALAAILAAGPRVLLLDEPTRGLDYTRKDELARLLSELAAAGTAVLVATHDVELVARWAERVVVLEDGRIAADGGVHDVLPRFPALAPQILRLFGDPRRLTEEDVP